MGMGGMRGIGYCPPGCVGACCRPMMGQTYVNAQPMYQNEPMAYQNQNMQQQQQQQQQAKLQQERVLQMQMAEQQRLEQQKLDQ